MVALSSNRRDTHTKPQSVLLAHSRSAHGQCFGCSVRRSGAVRFAFTMFRNLTNTDVTVFALLVVGQNILSTRSRARLRAP